MFHRLCRARNGVSNDCLLARLCCNSSGGSNLIAASTYLMLPLEIEACIFCTLTGTVGKPHPRRNSLLLFAPNAEGLVSIGKGCGRRGTLLPLRHLLASAIPPFQPLFCHCYPLAQRDAHPTNSRRRYFTCNLGTYSAPRYLLFLLNLIPHSCNCASPPSS
jgi:hypothetical protein